MIEFAEWLQSTSFSVAIQASTWAIPLLQSLHILMIGVVFVSIFIVTLRLLGRVRADQSLAQVWARFAPWVWVALVTMLVTGALLIIAEPVRQFTSTSFWLKMGLIVIAVASAAGFAGAVRTGTLQQAAGPAAATPRLRITAVATVVLWVAIIFLGRAIAYDVEVWGALSLSAQS